MSNKIYIAGFDVFYQNGFEIGQKLKGICEKHGFIGIFPIDNSIDPNTTKSKLAKAIFEKDIAMIEEADIIVANLNCFRGAEPDSGTSFELGYGYARGKKLYGYIGENTSLFDKVAANYGVSEELADGKWLDKDKLVIEDLDLPVNLMLAIPTEIVHGTFEDCIIKLKHELQENKEKVNTN